MKMRTTFTFAASFLACFVVLALPVVASADQYEDTSAFPESSHSQKMATQHLSVERRLPRHR